MAISFIFCVFWGGIGLSKILAEDEKTYELKSIHADQIQSSIRTRTLVDSMVNNMDASASDGVKKVIADNYFQIISGLSLASFAVIVIASIKLLPMLTLAVVASSLIKDVIAGNTIFTSVNEFVKALQDVFEYSISGPTNVFHYTPYQQHDFFKSVPDLPDDVKDGLCYALTVMWYVHLIAGDNLLDKLKNIDVSTHQHLIADILAIQRSHSTCLSTEKTKNVPQYRLKLSEELTSVDMDMASLTDHQTRMTTIKAAIETAMANPGCLVILSTTNLKKDFKELKDIKELKLKSHATGIMVDQRADHYYIRYFDSNDKEAVFTDSLSAQISISRSQAYHYLSKDMHKMGYAVYDLQEKPFLFWKTTTKKSVSQDTFNPRVDIAATLDFHL